MIRFPAGARSPLTALLLMALFCSPAGSACAQGKQSLALDQCYQQAEANYPLIRQRGLIQKTKEYNLDNIRKGIFPQLNISGSATYQSDVTRISIPPINGFNIDIPTVPKDQYKLYGEVTQTLTDFGINQQKRSISNTDAQLQDANLTSSLFALHDRIDQLFFGILLIDGQLKQNELSKNDVRTGIAKVQAAIANGTDFNSSLNKLKAELLKEDQQAVDLRASRRAYTDMLSLFVNSSVDDSTILITPGPPSLSDSVRRPELLSYDLQTQSYIQQQRLTRLSNYPHLEAFFQGGLGKPNPVNFLSTQVSGYYLTGLRLNWNFGGLYTYRKDKLINKNNQEMVATERSTFLFNTHLTLRQQNADIVRYQQLIASDDEIVALRDSVKQTSAVQLQNGVITANDYVLDINASAQAREDRTLHQIQLLIAEFNHKTTSGN